MGMKLTVNRFSDNNGSTLGLLFVDSKFFAFTLEDKYQAVKVPKETCIPEGYYELKINATDTPLTIKHREVYNKGYSTPWFKYHIEITGIPHFQGVYIHAGNDKGHTEGCLLVGDDIKNNTVFGSMQLTFSTAAVKRLYDLIYPVLEKGERMWIAIQYPKLV